MKCEYARLTPINCLMLLSVVTFFLDTFSTFINPPIFSGDFLHAICYVFGGKLVTLSANFRILRRSKVEHFLPLSSEADDLGCTVKSGGICMIYDESARLETKFVIANRTRTKRKFFSSRNCWQEISFWILAWKSEKILCIESFQEFGFFLRFD